MIDTTINTTISINTTIDKIHRDGSLTVSVQHINDVFKFAKISSSQGDLYLNKNNWQSLINVIKSIED